MTLCSSTCTFLPPHPNSYQFANALPFSPLPPPSAPLPPSASFPPSAPSPFSPLPLQPPPPSASLPPSEALPPSAPSPLQPPSPPSAPSPPFYFSPYSSHLGLLVCCPLNHLLLVTLLVVCPSPSHYSCSHPTSSESSCTHFSTNLTLSLIAHSITLFLNFHGIMIQIRKY